MKRDSAISQVLRFTNSHPAGEEKTPLENRSTPTSGKRTWREG